MRRFKLTSPYGWYNYKDGPNILLYYKSDLTVELWSTNLDGKMMKSNHLFKDQTQIDQDVFEYIGPGPGPYIEIEWEQ